MRLFVILLCLLATACGVTMKPGSEPRNRREIPPGRGIMTGEEGEFVIYRVKRTPPAKKANSEGGEGGKEGGTQKMSNP